MALKALRDPQVRQAVSESYDAIFVDEYQDVSAIQEAVIESEDYCFELRATADADYIGAIVDAGVEIYEVPQEELARMKEACAPIYQTFLDYGLGDLLDTMGDAGINLEYTYAFLAKKANSACIAFRVTDNEAASKLLAERGIKTLGQEDLPALFE